MSRAINYTTYNGRAGLLMPDKIMYMTKERDYVLITLVDGTKIESSDSLNTLEARIKAAAHPTE